MSVRVGQAGVYAIINLDDGTTYIGSTNNFEKRWYEHRWALIKGCHWNAHLQGAWSKYGEDAFKFTVVEIIGGSADDMLGREQHWLDFMQEHALVYNKAMDVRMPLGKLAHTEEARKKLAKTVKKAWADGLYDHVHNAEWSRKSSLGLKAAHARGCYENAHTEESAHKRSESMKVAWARGDFDNPEWCRKVALGCAKPYPAFAHTETGKIIPAGINLRQMCKEQGLSQSKMWRVQHGQIGHHKGWRAVWEAL